MNHTLVNIARIAFRTLLGTQQPNASKRRRAKVDFSSPEQLELRKLLTATISDVSTTLVMGTNYVVLSGTVQDDQGAGGLLVNFGGALQGTSVGVDDDGSFSYVIDDTQVSGNITAQTYSWDGTSSNIADFSVAVPA